MEKPGAAKDAELLNVTASPMHTMAGAASLITATAVGRWHGV